MVLFFNVCKFAALYYIAQEAGQLRAYWQESTMWKIGTWKTICVWVMKKNEEMAFMPYNSQRHGVLLCKFGAVYCVAFLRRGYSMLCLCCVVCNVTHS